MWKELLNILYWWKHESYAKKKISNSKFVQVALPKSLKIVSIMISNQKIQNCRIYEVQHVTPLFNRIFSFNVFTVIWICFPFRWFDCIISPHIWMRMGLSLNNKKMNIKNEALYLFGLWLTTHSVLETKTKTYNSMC